MLTATEQQQVDEFVAANDSSRVIEGWAIEPDLRKPARGGCYKFESGTIFKLNVAECRAVPDGYPKWYGQ